MAKSFFFLLLGICLLPPISARAVVAECGDGSVPVGVWPNCEPCAGGGAMKAMQTILEKHGGVMDETMDTTGYDYVEKCLASLKKIFFLNVGLPSLEEILGALCQATRQYTQQWVDKINQTISLSDPYGIVSGEVGVGNSSGNGVSIKVKDTSRQAVEAAKGCL